jgi:hypothetical protein
MSSDAATLDYRYLPQAIAPLGKRTRPRPQVKLTGSSNTTTSQLGGFESHFEKLKALAINQALWVDEQHPPSQDALAWARYILQNLQEIGVQPTKVVASAEGGAAICFVDRNKYADLECLNSGVILGVISNKQDRPVVWEIEPDARSITHAIERIREFIYESNSNAINSRQSTGR